MHSLDPEPLVSVVIPTFNYGHFLSEAIDSVLAQTYPRYEILVIDDGSTDDTAAIARQFGSAVRYVYQSNCGLDCARNTGVRESTGQLIALLDSDDRWLPHKLERQIPHFTADPAVALSHAGIRFFEGNRILGEKFEGEHLSFHDILNRRIPTCQTATFRRSVIDDIGWFDESLRGYGDWDMWLRIALRFKTIGTPEILAEARVHGSNMGASTAKFAREMRVITKHRRAHPGCPDCRRAARNAIASVRQAQADCLNAIARQRNRDGRHLAALPYRLRAIWHHPAELRKLLRLTNPAPLDSSLGQTSV